MKIKILRPLNFLDISYQIFMIILDLAILDSLKKTCPPALATSEFIYKLPTQEPMTLDDNLDFTSQLCNQSFNPFSPSASSRISQNSSEFDNRDTVSTTFEHRLPFIFVILINCDVHCRIPFHCNNKLLCDHSAHNITLSLLECKE